MSDLCSVLASGLKSVHVQKLICKDAPLPFLGINITFCAEARVLSRESLDTVKLRMVNGSSSGDLNCKVRGDTSSFSSISPCEIVISSISTSYGRVFKLKLDPTS